MTQPRNIVLLIADYNNPQHAQHIVDLLCEYAEHPMGGGQPLPQYSRDNVVQALANIPNAYSVLCYVDDQPAGLVNCIQGFSTFKCKPLINIHDLMVSANFRRMGLTKKMLAKAEDVARERGCCKVTLEVLEGNPIAQQAYRSYGFESYELDPKMGKAMFWEKIF